MRGEKKIDESITAELRRKLKKKYTPTIAKFFHPTTLNLIGFGGAFFAGLSFFLTSYSKYWFIGAMLGIVIHFLCDEFDGAVARYRKITSEHGFYLDHMLDELGVLCIFIGLGASPLMRLSLALGIIITYYIISMNVFLTTCVRRWFQISFEGLGPREGEI
ncbi:MAG: CDP-alcohol phosphatidyltransferase family protein, partial [Candidatus Pacearchaeota archaeon]|nr:CDP-alcohol phosphatidyltransferase family protein [Candidatus Pacearchaeota archaeon]